MDVVRMAKAIANQVTVVDQVKASEPAAQDKDKHLKAVKFHESILDAMQKAYAAKVEASKPQA